MKPQAPTVEQLLSPLVIDRLRAWLRTQRYSEFEMVKMIKNRPEYYLVLILTFLNREATNWGDLHRTTNEYLKQMQISTTELLRVHKELYNFYKGPSPPTSSPKKYLWFSVGLVTGLVLSLVTLILSTKLKLFQFNTLP